MKSKRTGRRRHLRRTSFDRFRQDPSGVHRQSAVGYWATQGTRLAGTAAATTFTAAAFATNEIAITGHGLVDGDGPFLATSATTLPAGLSATEQYWVGVVDANTLMLYRQRSEINDVEVGFTDAGTGVHTLTRDVSSEGLFGANKVNRPETIESATDIDDL